MSEIYTTPKIVLQYIENRNIELDDGTTLIVPETPEERALALEVMRKMAATLQANVAAAFVMGNPPYTEPTGTPVAKLPAQFRGKNDEI